MVLYAGEADALRYSEYGRGSVPARPALDCARHLPSAPQCVCPYSVASAKATPFQNLPKNDYRSRVDAVRQRIVGKLHPHAAY